MTENPQNADFRRKPQIFADSLLLLEIQAFGGRRKLQKTADFRRKPKIFAENRRKPQIGVRHLRCVTFSSSLAVEHSKAQRYKCGAYCSGVVPANQAKEIEVRELSGKESRTGSRTPICLPRRPGDRKKVILARTHEKIIPPRTKEPFSLKIFILGLKISFSLENFNPGPCFSAAREGLGMKKTILD